MLDADRTDLGRLFQAIGPAAANACWPKLVLIYQGYYYSQKDDKYM